MKLNLDSSVYQPAVASSSAAARVGIAPREAEMATGGDSVSMSGLSTALRRFSAERGARIDALTQAVVSGNYRVSSADIGKALIQHAGG